MRGRSSSSGRRPGELLPVVVETTRAIAAKSSAADNATTEPVESDHVADELLDLEGDELVSAFARKVAAVKARARTREKLNSALATLAESDMPAAEYVDWSQFTGEVWAGPPPVDPRPSKPTVEPRPRRREPGCVQGRSRAPRRGPRRRSGRRGGTTRTASRGEDPGGPGGSDDPPGGLTPQARGKTAEQLPALVTFTRGCRTLGLAPNQISELFGTLPLGARRAAWDDLARRAGR